MAVTGWFVIGSNVCKVCAKLVPLPVLPQFAALMGTFELILTIALRTAFCCPDSAVFRLGEFCCKLKDEYQLFINVVLSSMIRALSPVLCFRAGWQMRRNTSLRRLPRFSRLLPCSYHGKFFKVQFFQHGRLSLGLLWGIRNLYEKYNIIKIAISALFFQGEGVVRMMRVWGPDL